MEALPFQLKDNLTGELIELTNPYTFTSQSGKFIDRFTLQTISRVLSEESLGSEMIYEADNTLFVRYSDQQNRTVTIFDLSGQVLMKTHVIGSQEVNLSGLRRGVYLVSDGSIRKRIVVD